MSPPLVVRSQYGGRVGVTQAWLVIFTLSRRTMATGIDRLPDVVEATQIMLEDVFDRQVSKGTIRKLCCLVHAV